MVRSRTTRTQHGRRRALLLLLLVTVGCQQLRLPAIDPSGERIFLPSPSYTTLERPECLPDCVPSASDCPSLTPACPTDVSHWLPCLPKPAFTQPPPPPPCDENGMPPPVAPQTCSSEQGPQGPRLSDGLHPGVKYGRLVVTPGRVVAPVGSEVVLLAGLCDPAGFYVVKQPIEWLMSQESVGHIVDVGEPGYGLAPPMFNRGSRKIGVNYAIGTSVSKTATFTRGTAQADDDFTVRRGQSWISVTSPTEGVTHVTVWAPNAKAWDLRRQTATVHWVDAQWSMPAPAIVPAGQRHLLRTRVTHTSGAAARGWMVHYEVVDGPPATFGVNGPTAVDVPVDVNGDAVAELVPQTGSPGTTRILVQIVRPGEKSGEPARMVLGQGYTNVVWSAAGLDVRATGPASAGVGDLLTYQVTVANPGDLPARNVVLRDVSPPVLEYLNSSPSAQPMGDYLQWNLGDLGPRQSVVVTLNVRARQNGDIRYCFRASAENNVEAEGCAETRIFSSMLSLDVTGPETAAIGQQITYFITVRNTGAVPLTNVAIVDRFDPGLRHAGGQASPIERVLGDLQPGQSTAGVAVTFVVAAAGRHCHTVQVSADGGHSASAQRCVVATEAPPTPPPAEAPQLEIRLTGPGQLQVGQRGLYTIEVRNVSQIPANNLRVSARFPAALRPVSATENNRASEAGQAIAWTVRDIAPGATLTREIEAEGVQAAEGVVTTAVVATEQGVRQEAQTATTIVAAPGAPGPRPGPGPAAPGPGPGTTDQQPVTGQLEARLYSLQNPVTVGQPVRFLVGIRNNRNVSDRNVTVTVTLPPGVRVQRVAGPGVRSREVGNEIRWEPVLELREQEELRPPFEVELLPTEAGRIELKVRVESQRLRQPLELQESVDVIAR